MPDDTLTTGAARAAGLLTIKQAAEAAGITERMARKYEQIGLLTSVRSESGYRMFREPDIQRLRLIAAGRAAGLGLDTIGDLLAAADGDQAKRDRAYQIVVDHKAAVDKFVGDLALFYLGDKA